jgi:hypothetical protein
MFVRKDNIQQNCNVTQHWVLIYHIPVVAEHAEEVGQDLKCPQAPGIVGNFW